MTDNRQFQPSDEPVANSNQTGYQVLARKYRPTSFSNLIGQEAMIRTLTNAFESGRLAHAFILTGVRGVGKTTTARIIAKALNCVGPDGTGGPTIEPCGMCENCAAITEVRHLDVMEMDAASRTGVDDIRELIEGVRYKPVSARYKVYIVDEVHMLSRNAFNALLKTLEEPPPHVKFIFATTEIRKVPVTVLSRCQRFDLRRINSETLSKHFAEIAKKEKAKISIAALALVARVADGSVRDGQSLLDQIITTAIRDNIEISDDDVRKILGMADRERTFDLLEQVMQGDIKTALDSLNEDYINGADPLMILQDLLELVHWLTRIKVSPSVLNDLSNPESDRIRGKALSENISIANLSRAWQMLIKGLGETQTLPSPIQAVEMILVRLTYLGNLPLPADAVKTVLQDEGEPEKAAASLGASGGSEIRAMSADTSHVTELTEESYRQSEQELVPKHQLHNLEQIISLLDDHNERILMNDLKNKVDLMNFEPGKIEILLAEGAHPDTPQRLSKFLNAVTGEHWTISAALRGGDGTIKEQNLEKNVALPSEVAQHPIMKSVMENFPGAEIETIRNIGEVDETSPEEN